MGFVINILLAPFPNLKSFIITTPLNINSTRGQHKIAFFVMKAAVCGGGGLKQYLFFKNPINFMFRISFLSTSKYFTFILLLKQ